jgi:hypothetical protein
MKLTLLIVIGLLTTTASARQSGTTSQVNTSSYELYSWRESDGDWRFSLVPSPSGRNVYAEEVFSKNNLVRGIANLKARLSALPAGATITWLDRIPPGSSTKVKESMAIAYPPPELIREIERYAKAHKIALDVPVGKKGT